MLNLASNHRDFKDISLDGVHLSFDGFEVLKGVDIALASGRIRAITGENGAGKSSLAKVIAGIYAPSRGRIKFGDVDVRLRNPKEARQHGVVLIHQEPVPMMDLSIAENIFCGQIPVRNGIVDWNFIYAKSQSILEGIGVNLDVRQLASSLSIAEQQMLEVAAALVQNPKIWIFDETSAPLTPVEKLRLFNVMKQLRDQGCAVAMVTHHLDEVMDYSDDITVLRNGEVVAHLNTPSTSVSEIVRLMVGRDVTPTRRLLNSADAPVAVEVRKLAGVGFREVSLEILEGEIFGIAGLVGAGRTEFANALFGISPFTRGEFLLCGNRVMPRTPDEAIRLGIGLVPEDRRRDGVHTSLPIRENVSLVALRRFATKLGWIQATEEVDAVTQTLGDLQVSMRNLAQPVGELSGGNQQKVSLAKWLMGSPKFLILDEPTRGVDVGAKSEVHVLIRDVASQGVPILLISSDLPEILALCDRVGVMNKGTLVHTLTREELTESKIMEFATQ